MRGRDVPGPASGGVVAGETRRDKALELLSVAISSRRAWTHEQLVAGIRAGDRRALARAISLVENRDPGAETLVRDL